jgi:hypothetical protein
MLRTQFAINACLLIAGILAIGSVRGQEAAPLPPPPSGPVNLEPFIGTEGLLIATNYSKPLLPASRFGIFAITEFYGGHEKNGQPGQDRFMGQAHLTHKLLKNLSLSGGAITDQVNGFRPTAGVQYQLRPGDFFILFAPRMDLTPSHNGELFGFVEYTPRLKGDWRLYSRVQALYNQDLEHGTHAFSYLRLRLGAAYRSLRFGLGSNFSSYGPYKVQEEEFGLFVGALLF